MVNEKARFMVNLHRLFNDLNVVRQIRVLQGTSKAEGPEESRAWLILTGTIKHDTGTDTNVLVMAGTGLVAYTFKTTIPSATGSGWYPLFGTNDDVYRSPWVPVFLAPDYKIYVIADPSAHLDVQVLEFWPFKVDMPKKRGFWDFL